ncbi:hypothetical protein [uncultured Bdellovibrio sp.]|uniref:hypothetical protein n=1 Tax=Bdellovibrio sp. HCB-162 TaxID=3394234 RepID=UPI0025CDD3BA|nr:hypothetical protein [uncultured Bdellovibrio sp.]
MSIDNGTSQLSFPLRGEIPSPETLIVRDIDVVGTGALRRHQLEELQKTKKFILHTHESMIPESVQSIYQAELIRTLQWLRPVKTVKKDIFDFLLEEQVLFSKIFPETTKALGFAVNKIRDHYLDEMEWSSWLLQDHWRYFVGFLRQMFPDKPELMETAHWEWVQAWIEIQPFDLGELEKNVVIVNPSLQIVSFSQNNAVLKRDKGMYAFVYSREKATVVERALDVYEAQFIDLLQEDRKYTPQQLTQTALLSDEITPQLSSEEWQKKFFSLCQDAILICET